MSDGLPIVSNCNGCGACCRHMGHPIFMTAYCAEPAWRRLPKHLKRELKAYDAARADANGGLLDDYGQPCIWLDPDGSCRHYEHRPQVCRDFEVGSQACLRFREQQGIQEPHDGTLRGADEHPAN